MIIEGGVAASIAIKEGKTVQEVDAAKLADKLKQEGAVLKYNE